ncbi:SUKH-4 immunity protein [Nonomuraea solani]|uniref:SUKH-4 immunity protein n=1 Tax=Nonomuraea solani TaxID=1144553 RepID=A0A1H6F475_9ACTN|nr:SUKH-4 family immunity protein [Nonomuraea solani]SEH03906.1 SUKH-4 immunity protein [Nonomuraea solani]
MLDRERLLSAFDVLGLEVTTSPLTTLAGRVTDETAKRVISAIGIPERIGGYLTFTDFTDGPTLISDEVKDPNSSLRREAGDCIFLGSGAGILVLNGQSGEVASWNDGTLRTISSALDKFVEFMVLLQEKLNIAEKEDWPTGGAESRQASNELVRRFCEIDGEAMEQARAFWRSVVSKSFRSMGF